MALYLATSGNPLCWKSIFQYPTFWITWELCLPVLNFPSTRRGYLVQNISVWQLLQHCRSSETMCSLSFELTCLKRQSSDCIFSSFCSRSVISLFMLAKVESNLFCDSRTKATNSSLDSFLSPDSDSDIVI